jgi:hypothetical protein
MPEGFDPAARRNRKLCASSLNFIDAKGEAAEAQFDATPSGGQSQTGG